MLETAAAAAAQGRPITPIAEVQGFLGKVLPVEASTSHTTTLHTQQGEAAAQARLECLQLTFCLVVTAVLVHRQALLEPQQRMLVAAAAVFTLLAALTEQAVRAVAAMAGLVVHQEPLILAAAAAARVKVDLVAQAVLVL
jgi:hypothetical protein